MGIQAGAAGARPLHLQAFWASSRNKWGIQRTKLRRMNSALPPSTQGPESTGWWALVKQTVQAWQDDHAASMGAALSYYTFFSLAPLLLIVVSLVAMVYGPEAAQGYLASELQGLFGEAAAETIQALVAQSNERGQGWLGTTVGVLAMLVGATTVFAELQDALDRIWRAPARASNGLWRLLRARVLSFGLILGLGFLMVVSLVAGAVMAALGDRWGALLGSWQVLAQAVNLGLGFVLTTLVFAMIYKLMPRVKVSWRDVLLGAVVTSALFSLGKLLIGLYLGYSGLSSAFGAAGSLVVVLIWVYYSAQIFLLGAEFTWVYALTRGSRRMHLPEATESVPPAPSHSHLSAPTASPGRASKL